ncbi:hypothetical protein RJ639_015006 [Escallonia herrerae]|uniref:Uncharacterized protein n=1 Tax=Escallonia herrerae TaxID=1293975 RepID=A0AA88VIV8_9ASTE|nr:hypothetical protein RJ639_015006 [Escallonia herrerae]
MAISPKLHEFSLFFFFLLLTFVWQALGASEPGPPPQCESKRADGCHDKTKSLRLKLIAIASILVTSMIGICLPLLSRAVPDRNLFVLVKAFASGVILATGYMHVMPDSWDCLTSECLPENPWRKFPFTTFVAMLSAVLTLMVDSFAMSMYKKHCAEKSVVEPSKRVVDENVEMQNVGHCHANGDEDMESQLRRYRVLAQVLELGIIVHSVVIGLSMGASDNPCTIRPLVAALCFHQLFEGMGLGGCILQASYQHQFMECFSTLPRKQSHGSDRGGSTECIISRLLNYMALVDLLASDFRGSKLQGSMKLQMWAYVAVLLGAGGMSLLAKWA